MFAYVSFQFHQPQTAIESNSSSGSGFTKLEKRKLERLCCDDHIKLINHTRRGWLTTLYTNLKRNKFVVLVVTEPHVEESKLRAMQVVALYDLLQTLNQTLISEHHGSLDSDLFKRLRNVSTKTSLAQTSVIFLTDFTNLDTRLVRKLVANNIQVFLICQRQSFVPSWHRNVSTEVFSSWKKVMLLNYTTTVRTNPIFIIESGCCPRSVEQRLEIDVRLQSALSITYNSGPRFMQPIFDVVWLTEKSETNESRRDPCDMVRRDGRYTCSSRIGWELAWQAPRGKSAMDNAYLETYFAYSCLQRGRVIVTNSYSAHLAAIQLGIPQVVYIPTHYNNDDVMTLPSEHSNNEIFKTHVTVVNSEDDAASAAILMILHNIHVASEAFWVNNVERIWM